MLRKPLQSPNCTTHSLDTIPSKLSQLQILAPLFRHSQPHGSQDFNLCDYYMCGALKEKLSTFEDQSSIMC